MRKNSLLLCLLIFTTPVIVPAQTKTKDEIKVFLDCNAWCDMSYIKTEINYVDFVPDRFLANVYIMVTSQSTGSGGQEIKLQLAGQENFKAMNDTLQFYRNSVDTDDEYRQRLVQYIKLGLTRYIAKTSLAQKIEITASVKKNEKPVNSLTNKKDKWNFWVFNIGANGYYNADDQSKSYRYSGNLSANRVTERLKVNISANISRYEGKVTYSDGSSDKYFSDNSGLNATIVKSITNHFSVGGFASLYHSTYSNYNIKSTLQPAIEYSLFPYKEAVKKSITLFYQAGISYNKYIDSSYYNNPDNVQFSQSLSLNVAFTQKWGNLNFSSSWSNLFGSFHLDSAKVNGTKINTFSLGGYLEVRIVKGLSFYISTDVNFTKGIYPNIPRKNFSNVDILTNTRQYPTQKGLYANFGINYRFGSIYNNVVNPRFSRNSF